MALLVVTFAVEADGLFCSELDELSRPDVDFLQRGASHFQDVFIKTAEVQLRVRIEQIV